MWAAHVRHDLWTSATGRRLTSSRSIASAPCALRSVLWAPTEKEAPSDAAVPSHQLLLRAGFVRKSGHGVFALLPLGRRVVAKLEALIDEEMALAGGNRVDLPVLIPSELWKQSGRWQTRGPELMALQDRRDDVLALGPTHEESITSLVAANYNVTDSAQTSLRLYQIGRKFRDEIRPRFGLLRAREFIMKDMYSFDASYDGALQSYEEITTAYNRLLLSRLKLPVKRVEADSGSIGGNLSHEFHVLADIGEDAILSCASPECDYAANVEKAHGRLPSSDNVIASHDDENSVEIASIIAQLEEQARTGSKEMWETVVKLQEATGPQGFSLKLVRELEETRNHDEDADENDAPPSRLALCFARHDREMNELAAKPFFGGNEGEVIKNIAKVVKVLAARTSFVKLNVLLDDSLKHGNNATPAVNALCAVVEQLAEQQEQICVDWGNFRLAQAGDCCPRCNDDDGAMLEDKRGIEVGHVFYLSQKYSEPFGATYIDAKNKKHPLEMGCYGLGVTRLVAAAVESLHDEHGIVWPTEIAPFKVLVMSIGGKNQEDPVSQTAWQIAGQLASGEVAGLVRDDVLLDDRWRESPGSKLAESELIGYPYRIVVGRRFTKEGLVEVQTRATMEKVFIPPEELPVFFSERARQDDL